MTNKSYKVIDGGIIEWIDKETLRYSEGLYSVSVWVDYAAGIFNDKRIVRLSSIKHWDTKPQDASDLVTKAQQQRIIKGVQQYFLAQGKMCTVEE